jgi:hypothetical protein
VRNHIFTICENTWFLPRQQLDEGKMSEELSTKDDVVGPGVARIATATPDDERRVRHLMRAHGFPHFKLGNLLYSRRSWIDRYYRGETVDTSARGRP